MEGAVDHEDFAGNAGTIEAGDLQFMTAGKGIMHAEMPRQNADGSANIGMQLWVDLPQELKKCEPRYRDLRASEIPNIDIDDGKVHIKIISGQSHGVDSVQELAYTPVWILDIEIRPGGKITQVLPEGWNAFAYTLSGSTVFGAGKDQTTVGQFHNVVFEQKGDEVYAEVEKGAKENGHFSKSSIFLIKSRLNSKSRLHRRPFHRHFVGFPNQPKSHVIFLASSRLRVPTCIKKRDTKTTSSEGLSVSGPKIAEKMGFF